MYRIRIEKTFAHITYYETARQNVGSNTRPIQGAINYEWEVLWYCASVWLFNISKSCYASIFHHGIFYTQIQCMIFIFHVTGAGGCFSFIHVTFDNGNVKQKIKRITFVRVKSKRCLTIAKGKRVAVGARLVERKMRAISKIIRFFLPHIITMAKENRLLFAHPRIWILHELKTSSEQYRRGNNKKYEKSEKKKHPWKFNEKLLATF